MSRQFPVGFAFASAIGAIFSYFEYYYVTLNGIPYREISHSGPLGTPPYFFTVIVPAFLLVSFSPMVTRWVMRTLDRPHLTREFVVCAANFLWAMTLNNAMFYGLRVSAPLPTDPLAGHWITLGEAPIMGLVNLFGTLLPTWYFLTAPIAISVYLAYYIS